MIERSLLTNFHGCSLQETASACNSCDESKLFGRHCAPRVAGGLKHTEEWCRHLAGHVVLAAETSGRNLT